MLHAVVKVKRNPQKIMFQASKQVTLQLMRRNITQIQAYVASRSLSNAGDNLIHPSPQEDVPIPVPQARPGEPVEEKKARLLYQSRKRGMLENGLILSTFAKKYLSDMSVPDLEMYDSLINKPSNDWDIYYWTIGQRDPPEEFDNKIMKMLREHVQNKDLDKTRNCQPDL